MVFQGIITCPDGHLADIPVCHYTWWGVHTYSMIVLWFSTAGVEARAYKALNLGIPHVQLVDNIEENEKLAVTRNWTHAWPLAWAISAVTTAAMTTEQPLHMYVYPAATWYVSRGFNFALQSTVVLPLFLWMAPMNHIKTHWRELRYSSCVTQCLFQLGGWGQCVEQMEGGTLTLPLLCAQVRHRIDYNYKSTLDNACKWVE